MTGKPIAPHLKKLKPNSKGALFEELAEPNKLGFSRKVGVEEFVGKYDELKLGNGGSWCRDTGPLGSKYNLERQHFNDKPTGKIIAVKLHGHNTKFSIRRHVNPTIRNAMQGKRCPVLGTGANEIDHKDGRLDDYRLITDSMDIDDFQPMSKAANDAKRQHCKECKKTDKRFDARRLGYPIGQAHGNGKYRKTCVGCYWHDPQAFIRAVMERKPQKSSK